MNKTVKANVKLAISRGLVVVMSGKHVKVYDREGRLVTVMPQGSKARDLPPSKDKCRAQIMQAKGEA